MRYGLHLPLIQFPDSPAWSLGRLNDYVRAARELGYATIAANDHIVFPRAWLDGPTALAAVLPETGGMRLITSVALPVVRGPVQTAKALDAIDQLSGGRLVAGLGPGSSARDYAVAGVAFEERWPRFDEAVRLMKSLWADPAAPFQGTFYAHEGVDFGRAGPGGPPIWLGSWGSEAGLRRVARLADGWLASAYNTTPSLFAEGRRKLDDRLRAEGRGPLPNCIATMWTYVTEDAAAAERVLTDVVARMVGRPPEELRERVLIGSAESCARKLSAFREAGAEEVLLWPVAEELRQAEAFMGSVAPLVG